MRKRVIWMICAFAANVAMTAVAGNSGFMILQSGDARSVPADAEPGAAPQF